MESREVLQLRISYLRHIMGTLPNGWIGNYRDRPAVYLIHDPDNPDISNTNKRHYYIHTSKGKRYKQLIEQRIKYQVEYEYLMKRWRSIYIGDPDIKKFPLDKYRHSGILPSFFMRARPNQNTKENKHPIAYKGQYLRSKNELLSVKQIENMGFMWKTEVEFIVKGIKFYPDALFYVPFIEKVIALEIDGMMDDEEYSYKANKRKLNYYKAGLIEFKDVIFFRLTGNNDFDIDSLTRLIEFSIEVNAIDIKNNTVP